jgi:Tol biopolymer transport system component
MLAERAGQLVTREEIRSRLWSHDTFVDFERGINFCINQIRAGLGDVAESPRYVETLPKRGYRFIAPVTVEVSREPAQIVTIMPPPTKPSSPIRGQGTAPFTSSGIQVVSLSPTISLVPPWTWKRMAILVALLSVVSLAAGYAALRWLSRDRGPSLQDIRMTRLTSNGAVTGVAISPDGRYVAYAKLDGNRQSLWLRQIVAQTDVQILSPGSGFHGLTFSPDGNFIYFVRSDDSNPYFKYLYSMPTLGGAVKTLLTDVDSPVSFSPDGRLFVYEHCVEGQDDIELRVANTGGSNDHLLAMLHNATGLLFQPGPSWSPDGRTIVVPVSLVGAPNVWALNAVSVANGGVRKLLSRPSSIGRPVWVRGDRLLVPLFEPVGGRGQLWTVAYPEGKLQPFTNDLISYGALEDDYGFPLDVSRDGKAGVTLVTTKTAKTWVAPVGAPWEAKEVTNVELPLFNVAEAADRRLWAVSADNRLWIMNPDGSQAAPYGDYQNIDSIAACGQFMIVLHREAGPWELTRLDADGRHPTNLVSANLFGPFCSPDGKFVFYVSGEQPEKIWRVPVEGGAPVEIAQIPGDQGISRPNISPDGTLICYIYTKYGPSLGWYAAVIHAAGGPVTKTIPLKIEGMDLSWSPDGTGLQYLSTRNGVTNLWEQPLTGDKPKQVTRFTSGLILGFSWSFDRKRLLLTRGEINSDAILLSNLH